MDVSVGIDIGSTAVKVVLTSETDEVLTSSSVRSEWLDGRRRPTDLVDRLVDQVQATLGEATASGRPARPVGVGIASLAESGVLVTRNGDDATPILPWFDPRGGDLVAALPEGFRSSFPATTGMPLTALPTFAKLLWFRSQGTPIAGTWLSVGEYVAYRLTGEAYAEPSLASRTGLLDQLTGQPYERACQLLGADVSLLPPRRAAGLAWGVGRRGRGALEGAPVTVAGHDHLVAAYANDVVSAEDTFLSCGTADALVRVLPQPLEAGSRSAVVADGMASGRHVVDGRHYLIGGTNGGLVLRRTLEALGGPAARDQLDRAVMQAGLLEDASLAQRVRLQGPHADASMSISLHGDAGPAEVWAAALLHTNAALAPVLARMGHRAAPSQRAVATGGWMRMDSAFAAKRQLLPTLTRSTLADSGASGAARLGRLARAGASSGAQAPA